MFSQKTYRWFGLLVLVMLSLRLGYKYYRSQRPTYQQQLQAAQDRQQALVEQIQADQAAQRAQGATVVLADSAGVVTAADTLR